MNSTDTHPALTNWRDEVLGYRHGEFHLGYDLSCLFRSRQQKLHEATVLYAARILEALSGAALERVGLPHQPTTYSNLYELYSYGLTPQSTLYWANALRRVGNSVRHALRQSHPAEETVAAAFLNQWLHWFFCRGDRGRAGAASLTNNDDGDTGLIIDDTLREAMAQVERVGEGFADLTRRLMKQYEGDEVGVPAIISVFADTLLSIHDEARRAEAYTEAHRVLDDALSRYPEDLRLTQLKALCHSRAGDAELAMKVLRPIYRKHRGDPESTGIMGGIYKRMWRKTGDPEFLSKSHQTYIRGWERDRGNTYLGINTATTALFLDRLDRAAEVAAAVEKELDKRRQRLAQNQAGLVRDLCCWDQLTLVEAELLQKKPGSAARSYSQAVERFGASQAGDLDVARRQLRDVSDKLGVTDGPWM